MWIQEIMPYYFRYHQTDLSHVTSSPVRTPGPESQLSRQQGSVSQVKPAFVLREIPSSAQKSIAIFEH